MPNGFSKSIDITDVNVLVGTFSADSDSNGEATKKLLNKVNTLIPKKNTTKMIIPSAYGEGSILRHIENDEEDVIIIKVPIKANDTTENNQTIQNARAQFKSILGMKSRPGNKYVLFVLDVSKELSKEDINKVVQNITGSISHFF